MPTPKNHPAGISRRDFVKRTSVATAGLSAGLMASGNFAYAAGTDKLRVGLIGCGGRGTGAARDAVVSSPNVEIYAMGDLFEDRLDQSKEALQGAIGEALNVSESRSFTGFDNDQAVIDTGVDMVIIASPPGFHPAQLRAAVAGGKHVFLEKPAAVDPVGVQSVIESGKAAEEKGLSIVAGTLYRRQPSFVEAVQRIHDGMIGDIVGAQAYYLTGPVWLRERKPGMSDMEWQCRNWYYFNWLSGDHIVEQFVHNLDVIHWVMQAHPVQALGMGGRLQRVDPSFGHIYDHFSIEFEYEGGARVEAKCRQMEGCERLVTNRIVGTEGVAELHTKSSRILMHGGEVLFEHPESSDNAYVMEHTDLISSIREGKPINEARQVALSTLMGVLGRESAYTGSVVTWDEIAGLDLDLVPDQLAFGSMPFPPVPQPGQTSLDRAPSSTAPPASATSASG